MLKLASLAVENFPDDEMARELYTTVNSLIEMGFGSYDEILQILKRFLNDNSEGIVPRAFYNDFRRALIQRASIITDEAFFKDYSCPQRLQKILSAEFYFNSNTQPEFNAVISDARIGLYEVCDSGVVI